MAMAARVPFFQSRASSSSKGPPRASEVVTDTDTESYLTPLGYAVLAPHTWAEAPWTCPRRPLLRLGLEGRDESEGHTVYLVQCLLTAHAPELQLCWTAMRRLTRLRDELHAAVKRSFGDRYERLFASAPFAKRGAPAGTSERLEIWLEALAGLINSGVAAPGLVAQVFFLLDTPSASSGCLGMGEGAQITKEASKGLVKESEMTTPSTAAGSVSPSSRPSALVARDRAETSPPRGSPAIGLGEAAADSPSAVARAALPAATSGVPPDVPPAAEAARQAAPPTAVVDDPVSPRPPEAVAFSSAPLASAPGVPAVCAAATAAPLPPALAAAPLPPALAGAQGPQGPDGPSLQGPPPSHQGPPPSPLLHLLLAEALPPAPADIPAAAESQARSAATPDGSDPLPGSNNAACSASDTIATLPTRAGPLRPANVSPLSWATFSASVPTDPYAAEIIPRFLANFGYHAADAESWRFWPNHMPEGPQVRVRVEGHELVGNVVVYDVSCVICSRVPEMRLEWTAGRTLPELRSEVHDVAKNVLRSGYSEVFRRRPFASSWAPSGTTARLHRYMAALASAVNDGIAPPVLTAQIFWFLNPPVEGSTPRSPVLRLGRAGSRSMSGLRTTKSSQVSRLQRQRSKEGDSI